MRRDDEVRADWLAVMSPEEADEFRALELAITHTKQALTALSDRRGKVRNRYVMRINGRKHVSAP